MRIPVHSSVYRMLLWTPFRAQSSDACILFLGHRMSIKQSHWRTLKASLGHAFPDTLRMATGSCMSHVTVMDAHAHTLGDATPHLLACRLQFPKHAYDVLVEGEGYDRSTLRLQEDQARLWKVRALSSFSRHYDRV
jgi:hypothetical protein